MMKKGIASGNAVLADPKVVRNVERALVLGIAVVAATSVAVAGTDNTFDSTVAAWDNRVPGATVVAKALGLLQPNVARAYGELVTAGFLVNLS